MRYADRIEPRANGIEMDAVFGAEQIEKRRRIRDERAILESFAVEDAQWVALEPAPGVLG